MRSWDRISTCNSGWPATHCVDSLAWNSQRSACLCFLVGRITHVSHHFWLLSLATVIFIFYFFKWVSCGPYWAQTKLAHELLILPPFPQCWDQQVCAVLECVCVRAPTCGGQRTAFVSQFFSFTGSKHQACMARAFTGWAIALALHPCSWRSKYFLDWRWVLVVHAYCKLFLPWGGQTWKDWEVSVMGHMMWNSQTINKNIMEIFFLVSIEAVEIHEMSWRESKVWLRNSKAQTLEMNSMIRWPGRAKRALARWRNNIIS